MFKIGEFSKLTQVTVRMLRYYDETGLLKPAKTDRWTGYRLYSAEQIPVLNKIIYLRDSGFNVSEIAAALNADDSGAVSQLEEKCSEIKKTILREQEKLKKIVLAKQEILSGRSGLHYQVTVKAVPSFQVLSIRKIIPNYYAEGAIWKELSAFAKEKHVPVSNETFSIYHDLDYKEKDVDVELCALVEKKGENNGSFIYRDTQAVPFMASTMVYGDFSNIAGAYQTFAKWLSENGQYNMGGTSRQIVHRGPWNEENPQNYLVELQIPIDKIL